METIRFSAKWARPAKRRSRCDTLTIPSEPKPLPPSDLQAETLQLYTLLTLLRPTWAHALVLACNLTPTASALGLAANIAGSACLVVDPSHDLCRASLRNGTADFVVNSLDEALRALKNEIRRGRPLTVTLEADPAETLAAILSRGILPELFTATLPTPAPGIDLPIYISAAAALQRLGTTILDLDGTLGNAPAALDGRSLVRASAAEHNLTFATFNLPSASALRSLDTHAQALIPISDPRHRWTIAAPRHFTRPRPPESVFRRVFLITPSEEDVLRESVPQT